MKKIKIVVILLTASVLLIACEGRDDDGYDNAGLTEAELAHAQTLIDNSLTSFKNEVNKADSITLAELKAEIKVLKEEVENLKSKSKK